MDASTAEPLAVALLAFFACGWSALAGADIGLGMVLPFLARTARERRLVVVAIGPFFLAGEVWLIAAAGVFIGCFPDLEGELFQGQYPVLLPLLLGWVLRDAGLWWRGRADRAGWQRFADTLVTGGSWALALSWGWLLAGLASGDPSRPAHGTTAAVAALTVAALFAGHGTAFGALRLTGRPFERARWAAGRRGGRQTFVLTAAVTAALPPAAGAGLPLTGAAAQGPVLGLLVPALLATTPLLVAAQVWLWRTFLPRTGLPRTEGPSYL